MADTYTSGPWTVQQATPQCMRSCSFSQDTLRWEPDPASEDQFLCVIADSEAWQKTMPPYGAICALPLPNCANARLIAAAPDLLEAGEKALEDCNWQINNGKHLSFQAICNLAELLDAAIAKARNQV